MRVFTRVARVGDVVFLDLGDPTWRTVEITKAGWRVLDGGVAPIRFWRPSAMEALPLPAGGGRLAELRPHLNLGDDDEQWALAAGFLVSAIALAPCGPFPILIFHGEQGCTKTTATEHCASIIDPRRACVRAMPRDLEGLAIAAHNGYLLAFDNVSRIEPALSDGLCRLATGAGYAKRTRRRVDLRRCAPNRHERHRPGRGSRRSPGQGCARRTPSSTGEPATAQASGDLAVQRSPAEGHGRSVRCSRARAARR